MQYNQPKPSSGKSSQDIELSFSCFSLANEDSVFGSSDGFIELYSLDIDQATFQETRTLLGKTEVQHDKANPEFNKTFSVEYNFEKSQRFQAVVYDFDGAKESEVIGKSNFELGQVVTSLQNGLVVNLLKGDQERGRIKVKATIDQASNFEYHFDVRCSNIKDIEWVGKTDPLIAVWRPANKHFVNNDFTNTEWVEEYLSEWYADNLDPNFKPFKLKAGKLNKGNEQAPI